MTDLEFNSSKIENYVVINKCITQIVDNHCDSTQKKDYSWLTLSDKMRVRVQGKTRSKSVVKFFAELGYVIDGFIDSTEDNSYCYYIFSKD